MWRVVIVSLLLAGAARADERPLWKWEQPAWWEAAPLAAATGLIWTDVLMTRGALHRTGIERRNELNPLLGPRPSDARLFLVGGVLPTLALAGLWYALPYGWRTLPCAAVIGAEGGGLVTGFRF